MRADVSVGEFAEEVGRPDSEINLARAALVLARSEYPRLDVERYLARLDELARGAGRGSAGDDLGRLHRLREYLFEEQGFAGNCQEYFDERNSFLNDVLDRRLGIPITLALVLIEVGRRLGLRIEGIGLPGHFITGARIHGSQVLLDPFNGGDVLTVEGCGELVSRVLGRPVLLQEAHFAPVSNRLFLSRMLCNLKALYWRREEWEKAVGVIDRLLLLTPEAGGEWRDRGIALNNLGDLRRGLADWERYLTGFPNAPDHERVKGHLTRMRQRLSRLN